MALSYLKSVRAGPVLSVVKLWEEIVEKFRELKAESVAKKGLERSTMKGEALLKLGRCSPGASAGAGTIGVRIRVACG